ncbi:MAG: grasp-with-spasm system SPASM domain peptide maturase [Bacteroidetes bacterium]|nr:grasp-with-spasm system SPASM domain peptide maturase [Bacteroidota bacterium]
MEIGEYFDFLLKNELGFNTKNPEYFPDIDLKWQRPEVITNAIFDIDKNSNYDVSKVISQIQRLGCKNVEFRIFSGYFMRDLEILSSLFIDSIFRFVSILIQYDDSMTFEKIKALVCENPRIQGLILFSAPYDDSLEDFIRYTKQSINTANCCGVVHPKYFSPNLDMFSESQNFNTCLNRKVSVDVNGNIKNCPSMIADFGHVDEVDLTDVVALPEFQKYWKVSKNQIETCKVCEFRHVCTDCRAFTTDANSQYAKPSKCSYNPYTNTW